MTKLAPIALILILIPVMAHADSMTWSFTAYDSSMTFHISEPDKNINTQLGIFNIHINTATPQNWSFGVNFLAFCVDLERYVGNSQNVVISDMADWHQPYVNPNYPDYEGAGSYVASMINHFSMPDTLMEQSAMQLAVWETLYEDRDVDSFNVSSGRAYAAGLSTAVINQANDYLSFINGLTDKPDAHGPWIQTLDDGRYYFQDFTTPVPEPSTLVLLGVGLLGVGIAARRNSKNRK